MGAESRQELTRELEVLRSQAGQEVALLKNDLNFPRRIRSSYQAHQMVFVLGAIGLGFAVGWAGTRRQRQRARQAKRSFWPSSRPAPTPEGRSRSAWAVVLPMLHFLTGVVRPLLTAWARGALQQQTQRGPRHDGTQAMVEPEPVSAP